MLARQQLLRLRKRMTRNVEAELAIHLGPSPREIQRYLATYKKEFKSYQKVSTKAELIQEVLQSDILFNGDYHTLSQSQRIPLRILREVVKKRPRIVIATEVVMMKHQRHLEEYLKGVISEEEFLKKIEHDKTWGFDWNNFRPLFEFAKYHQLPIVGINTGKTGRGLRERDRRAAELVLGLTMLYPKHLIYVIFGELHMAKPFIPHDVQMLLKKHKLRRRLLTIFENSETIYWKLSEKGLEDKTDLVKLRRDAFCVMNAPPWVKLQSHIEWLERGAEGTIPLEENMSLFLDETDQVHSYGETIANYLNIGPGIDNFHVFTAGDFSFYDGLVKQELFSKRQLKELVLLLEANASFFIPKANIIYLTTMGLNRAAEEVTKYLYAKCSRYKGWGEDPEANFIQTILVEAFGFFGSKLLNHKRKCDQIQEYRLLLKRLRGKKMTKLIRERREIAKGVLLFKSRERLVERKERFPTTLPKSFSRQPTVTYGVAKALGYMLGERLYVGLMEGKLDRADLTRYFRRPLKDKQSAVALFQELLQRLKGVKSRYRGKIDHL